MASSPVLAFLLLPLPFIITARLLMQGRPFYEILEGSVYSCGVCRVPLARQESLASKVRMGEGCLIPIYGRLGILSPASTSRLPLQQFHARSGKAYLFHTAANISTGTVLSAGSQGNLYRWRGQVVLVISTHPEVSRAPPGPKEERMMTTGLHLVSGEPCHPLLLQLLVFCFMLGSHWHHGMTPHRTGPQISSASRAAAASAGAM